jgi:hypothetical protein
MKVDLDRFEIIPVGCIVAGKFLPNRNYPSSDIGDMDTETYLDLPVRLPAVPGRWAIRLLRRRSGTSAHDTSHRE